jgi:hypothetical protein
MSWDPKVPKWCPTLNNAGKASYYSARDWGYGLARLNGLGGESLNVLSFTRAIEQYHRYEWEGKRNAYLLLGHVIHLLQDNGEPDHALLTAHPASGNNDPESDSTYHRCEIAAGITSAANCGFEPICNAIWFGIAYGACEATVDPDEVGYERLVKDRWRLDRVESDIKKTGVLHHLINYETGVLHKLINYDDYFHAISETAQKALTYITSKYPSADLAAPLGCDEFVGVPGLDPFIDADDTNETEPFLALTDRIAPQVIGLSAGLIEHFFDIVNYPPYVERVVIVQWQTTGRPQPKAFAKFADDKTHCIRYDAEWIDAPPTSRNLVVKTMQYLTTDRPAFVFVQFGPSGIGPTLSKHMRDARLRVTGKYPGKATPIAIDVEMRMATDSATGPYYWGYFSPRNCCKDPYQLTLEISGEDAGPHFTQRQSSGGAVDAEPGTMARIDIASSSFEWKDYSPGTDKHHAVMVSAFDWRLDISPQPLVIPAFQRHGAELSIQLEQRFWDCQWEPGWGSSACAVEWKLVEAIKCLTTMRTGPAIDFGLVITQDLRHHGVKLRIQPKARGAKAGVYQVRVEYTLGEPPATHVATATFQIV